MAIIGYPFLNIHRRVDKKIEQTIASYIQTCQCSGQTGLNIKITTIEAKNCTVGDSIRIMMVDSQEEQAWAIASEQKQLQYWKEMLAGSEKYMEADCSWMQEEYRQNINKSMRRINALRESHPERITHYYESWNQGEVLAIYAVCHYDIYPTENCGHESKTETFIITPDGEAVIGKEPYGKLVPTRKKTKVKVV